MATVELIDDVYPTTGAAERMKLQQNLLEIYRRFIPEGTLAKESFQQMLSSQMSLGMLTDLISFTMPIPVAVKEQLLGTANVDSRARILLQCLGQMVDSRQENPTLEPWSFPPKFSVN